VLVDDSIDFTCDYQRWASLFRSSLSGASRTEMLDGGNHYWVVGTRNATEEALGTYSNISGAVSLQPLVNLWKSDVLAICRALGVPQLAIDKSRQVDCDCGRYDLAADHIEEVDAILMARAGQLSPAYLAAHIAPELLARLQAFVDEQLGYGGFKKQIPYIPDADLVGG
jgi:NH3-dependent NAD+ synthetase